MSWNSKEPRWHGANKPRIAPTQFVIDRSRVRIPSLALLLLTSCDRTSDLRQKRACRFRAVFEAPRSRESIRSVADSKWPLYNAWYAEIARRSRRIAFNRGDFIGRLVSRPLLDAQAESSSEARRVVTEMFPRAVMTGVNRDQTL